MNLDPTVSPWLGILGSTGVCLWMAAIGAPLAHGAFGHRSRRVWPFYAPILGVAAVLLTTNLAAYVAPGGASAWVGLLAPSALATVVAWRARTRLNPLQRSAAAFPLLVLPATGAFLLCLSYWTHVWFGDSQWHLSLVQHLARGGFPPVSPYGVDSGIGYHYGVDLLAASIVHAAAVPPWTALATLTSFLIVTLILASIGFTWDVGASLLLAIGAGVAIGLFAGTVHLGLPPYAEAPESSGSLAGILAGLTSAPGEGVKWVHRPSRVLGIGLVILIAAAFEAGTTRRQAAVMAVAAGVLALAEAAIMIYSIAALGVIGGIRLVKLPGRKRFTLAAAIVVAVLLVALAGGPISDALFGRGGTTGLVRIAFEPNWMELAPFELAGFARVAVGIIPLLVISTVIALRHRSLGLAFLATTGIWSLPAAALVQASNPIDDERFLYTATAIGWLALLVGLARIASGFHGWKRGAAILAALLLAVLPTTLPHAASVVRVASNGFVVGQPSEDGSDYPFVGQTHLRRELTNNWDFYRWLARSLPNHARLLTTHPGAVASIAGVTSPTSGRDMQALGGWITPVYEDALRFLHRDDLMAMGITHLHVTDALAAALTPQARRLLDDPTQFRLLTDFRSVAGLRHRVFEVASGAGTREAAPSSFRTLRDVVAPESPVHLLGPIPGYQRRMLLFTLIDQQDLHAHYTYVDRFTRRPSYSPVSGVPQRGEHSYVALPERSDPLILGFSRSDAIWAGYGIRVYDMASAWSPVFRIGRGVDDVTEHRRSVCGSGTEPLEIQLLGEPGDSVVVGSAVVELVGTPQVMALTPRDCETLHVLPLQSAAHVSPFAQVRQSGRGMPPSGQDPTAGLGFDGGIDDGRIVMNFWYRNPDRMPFSTHTEFRLYQIPWASAHLSKFDPRDKIRLWNGPLVLAADTQTARVEVDPRIMTLNGDLGLGRDRPLIPGETYILALNISRGGGWLSDNIEVQKQIPIAMIEFDGTQTTSEFITGITSVAFGITDDSRFDFSRDDAIDQVIDLTP